MPITVLATEGVLSLETEPQLFQEITDAFLKHHQLTGNSFLTPNVIGEMVTIPSGKSYAGGKQTDIVIVELKVPSFAMTESSQQSSFIAEVTESIRRLSGERVSAERIYVNMVYTVDGLWGIGGKAYTNAQLIEAVSAAAA